MDQTELKRRLVLDPSDREARFAYAEALFGEAAWDLARTQLEKLLAVDSKHANGLRLLARTCKALGEAGAARRALQQLVDAAPDDTDAQETLALAFIEDERPDDALFHAELSTAGAFAPQRYSRCVMLAQKTDRLELARAWAERGLLIAPDTELSKQRAWIISELGVDDAFELLGALRRDDALLEVREAIIAQDLALARRHLVTLAAEHDGRPEFHLLRGELLLLEKQPDRAETSFAKARSKSPVKVVTGALSTSVTRGTHRRLGVLGWHRHGGSLSPLEAVSVRGSGALQLSGNVKEDGREAVQLAFSLVKKLARRWGLEAQCTTHDVQVNYTDHEATKTGLSSGLALTLAIHHALAGKPIPPRVAVTGAITLQGDVARISGVHEKVTAAWLIGSRVLIVPKQNRADVEATPERIREGLRIHYVSTVDEGLAVLAALQPSA
ncbi:MAG: tetratricopeptide repeat protein [Archangium sp.]